MLPRLVLIGLLALLAVPLSAQDDLFDAPGGLFDDAPQVDPAEISAAQDENPLVAQLLEHSRRGDLPLATAISSLARLGRWSDVDNLLTGLSRRQADEATLALMMREIGPAVFLKIRQQPDLSEASQKALDQLAAAASAQAESPDRLRQAIDQLDNPSVDAQLAARRFLLGGGNAAVAELVAAAVQDSPPAPRDTILRAMLQFGDGGIESLRQLALYGTPPVRANAVKSLARISRGRHVLELVTAALASDASPDEAATAKLALEKLGQGVPSRGEAIELLEIEFRDRRDWASRIDNDNAVTTLWNINESRDGVTNQPASVMVAAFRGAADAAARLRRVGGLPPDTEAAVLASDLAYRIMVDNDWGDPDQVKLIRDGYGEAASGTALLAALASAMRESNHAAAIGLIRLIDTESPSVIDRNVLLAGNGATPTPLVQAASSPDPQVRFEAAVVVAELAGDGPYAGSSRVKRTLAEMVALGDLPSAILVETRAEVIVQLEAILSALGFDVQVVGSVSRLQRVLARGGDLRLLMSKTELSDLPAIEMIDLVRRTDRGRELPIALYGYKPSSVAFGRWDFTTTWVERPVSPAGLDGVIDAISRRRRLPPLSAIDRQRYREAATRLLETDALAN